MLTTLMVSAEEAGASGGGDVHLGERAGCSDEPPPGDVSRTGRLALPVPVGALLVSGATEGISPHLHRAPDRQLRPSQTSCFKALRCSAGRHSTVLIA